MKTIMSEGFRWLLPLAMVLMVSGSTHTFADEAAAEILERMTERLAHRGPDDRGTWMKDGAYLGHRRLSVIDPGPKGRQPMASEKQVIVFNGEADGELTLIGEFMFDDRAAGIGAISKVPVIGSDGAVVINTVDRVEVA